MNDKEQDKIKEMDEEWVENHVRQVLRDTPNTVIELYDDEHPLKFEQHYRDKFTAERARWRAEIEERKQQELERQAAIRAQMLADVSKGYGTSYLIYVDGKRQSAFKESGRVKCPSCPLGTLEIEGMIRGVWEKARGGVSHDGAPGDMNNLPFKVDSGVTCPNCKNSTRVTVVAIA